MGLDLKNRILPVRVEQVTKTADFDGATMDRAAYPGAYILTDVGEAGTAGGALDASNLWELKLYHATEDPAVANAALASSWAVVPEEQLIGAIVDTITGVFAVIDAADEDESGYVCEYIGPRRFLRVRYEATGTPGSTQFLTYQFKHTGVIPAV